jgi:hypothetical protein
MSRRSVSSVTRCREKSAISVPCSLTCSRYSRSARLLSCSRSRRCLRGRHRRRQGRTSLSGPHFKACVANCALLRYHSSIACSALQPLPSCATRLLGLQAGSMHVLQHAVLASWSAQDPAMHHSVIRGSRLLNVSTVRCERLPLWGAGHAGRQLLRDLLRLHEQACVHSMTLLDPPTHHAPSNPCKCLYHGSQRHRARPGLYRAAGWSARRRRWCSNPPTGLAALSRRWP